MSLETVQQLAITIGAVGGALGALWAALLAARKVPPFVWELLQTMVDHRRAKAARERQLQTLIELLPEIRAELKPDHGLSFRDAVDRIGRTTEDTRHEVEHLSTKHTALERDVAVLGDRVERVGADLAAHVEWSARRSDQVEAHAADVVARLGRLETGREGA